MMNKVRHTIIPAIWVVLKNDKNQIYLLRRANTGWRDGWYTVPAGHIEQFESPSAAAIRELKEEAGITAHVKDLGEPLIYFYPADDMKNDRVSLFFVITTHEGEPYNAEPDKADDAGWFDLDNLPSNVVPLLGRALKDLETKTYYSERYYDEHFRDELLKGE